MDSDCSRPKRNSRRDGAGLPDFLLSDGYLFERLSENEKAVALRFEKEGLIELSEFEYVRCVNPAAGDADAREVIDPSCGGVIPIGSADDGEIPCPSCGRRVFIEGKARYTGRRSHINYPGCVRYVENTLRGLMSEVKELSEGAFRCSNGKNEVHIIVWDCCEDPRFRNPAFSVSNPCLHIVVEHRKWAGRIPGAPHHIFLRDIVSEGSGILKEAINQAESRFSETLLLQPATSTFIPLSAGGILPGAQCRTARRPPHGRLVLENTLRGPGRNGVCAQLSGTTLKEAKKIGIRQFFFLYHIFGEGSERRCDNLSCTVIGEETLESRFLEWAGKGIVSYSSRTGAVEPVKYRIQKMWCECKRQLSKVPELRDLFFEWKDTGGNKYFGIKMHAEDVACHIKNLEELLEDSKNATDSSHM